MNILMLTKSLRMDGVTTCVIDFSNCMYKKGHKVCVCGKKDTEVGRLDAGIKFYDMNFYTKNPKVFFHTLRNLKKVVKEEKIDIIHCHWRMTTLYAKICSMFRKTEMIWQNHAIPIPHSLFYRMSTFYGKKAIAISSEGAEFLNQKMKIPSRKIAIINNGIDLKEYQGLSAEKAEYLKKAYNISPNEQVIVLFGRLDSFKGHEFLLNAVKNLNTEYKLLFTGEGSISYKAKLESISAKLGISDRVVFTGNVKANDILSIADVMVLPSIQEGFGIAVIEALALKVPVIRTKTGGYEDMSDCVDGVEYGDVEELARLLKINLECGEKVKERIEFAYEKVLEVWDIDKVVDKYLEVYNS